MTNELTPRKPLRLWPGVVAAVLLVLLKFGAPLVSADGGLIAVLGGVIAGLLIVVWWLFFSRAPWAERLGVLVLMMVATFAANYIVHPSISGGMMGMMLPIYLAVPGLTAALVAAVAITRRSEAATRRVAIVGAVVLACGAFALLRTDGVKGSISQITWRWTPTAEELLLAHATDEPLNPTSSGSTALALTPPPAEIPTQPTIAEAGGHATTPAAAPTAENVEPAAAAAAGMRPEWPGFRGPERDSVVRGERIATDWNASPPVQLWRRPIGPGWSSFAVRGDLLYTQEQRGDDEVVACYSVSTGKPVWMHKDKVRFYESNGGAGPRATPTLHKDRAYTFGATGILNALDAGSGKVVWSHDVATDSGRAVPEWGFTSSPLVVDDLVVVAAAGTLVAYDSTTGHRRWSGPSYGGSYSSPQRVTIDGVVQILLLGGPGAISLAPADGAVLWKEDWEPGAIVQPAQMPDGDILINTIASTGGIGIRRLHVTHGSGGWNVEERWTSNGLKPYFNDFVVHKGHAFGFDGAILSAIDLADGKRIWKGGRYGNGQLVLLLDQDLLLVLSEDGELALVSASADKFRELARVPALDGKTWNHPVLVGDILLVRNGQEMAAFRLKLQSS